MNYFWGSLLIPIHLRFHEIFFSDPNSRSLPMRPPSVTIFSFSFMNFFQFSMGLVFYACLNYLWLESWQFLPYFDTHKRVWLKWSPISFGSLTFGPREIWSLRNLGPRNLGPRNLVSEKFSPQEIWFQHENHFTAFYAGNNFLRAQISWGTNFSGSKKASGPNEIGDHFSCSFKKDFTPMLI